MADEELSSPDLGSFPEHKPLRLKGKRLDFMTDEELRPLLKWQPLAQDHWQSFPGIETEAGDRPTPRAPASGPTELASRMPGGAPRFGNQDLLGENEQPLTLGRGGQASPSWSATTEATLIDVVDGDTIRVKMPDEHVRTIRLRGYYAGEMGLSGGREARDALEKVLAAGKIRLSDLDDNEDPGGRGVATVGIEGVPDVAQLLAKQGFGTLRSPSAGGGELGPRGNDWRTIRKSLPPEALAQSYDLADKQKKYGNLKHRNRLNTSDPEYQRFLSEMSEFTERYGGGSRNRTTPKDLGLDLSNVPKPVAEAIQRMLDRRSGARDLSPPEERKFYLAPKGAAEWAAWGRSLRPKEKNLWAMLERDEKDFLAKAPAYHKKEYLSTKAYLEHRRLYDKFLHLTTDRLRRMTPSLPPQHRRTRRRRAAELPNDLQSALA
ncbi:MAG: hypothetical protein KGL39_12370 [Patescibacteria group bacterium]|nr:hypothetical protein [Patescibacteria group bacterium]